MQQILDKGHSRVPVYYEKPTNIIGLTLVFSSVTSIVYNLMLLFSGIFRITLFAGF